MDRSTELVAIVGIGPKIAEKLAAEGVGLVELAGLSEDDMDRLDVKLGLKGHIRSQDWRGQAAKLIASTNDAKPEEDAPAAVVEAAPEAPPAVAETDQRDEVLADALAMIKAMKAEIAALKAGGEETPAVEVRSTVEHGRRRRLNRNLDFGTVFGTHPTGATYLQVRDGVEVPFNHAGLEILAGENAGEPSEKDAEPEHTARGYEDFNPINYLDNKVKYPVDFVLKAVKARFGLSAKSEREAKIELHNLLRRNR